MSKVISNLQVLLDNENVEQSVREELARELSELHSKYKFRLGTFSITNPPFMDNKEKVVSLYLIVTSLDMEKCIAKHKQALDDIELFPNDRHKKMAKTKTYNTLMKTFAEKYDFTCPHESEWLYKTVLENFKSGMFDTKIQNAIKDLAAKVIKS